jgi:hypothetical protein
MNNALHVDWCARNKYAHTLKIQDRKVKNLLKTYRVKNFQNLELRRKYAVCLFANQLAYCINNPIINTNMNTCYYISFFSNKFKFLKWDLVYIVERGIFSYKNHLEKCKVRTLRSGSCKNSFCWHEPNLRGKYEFRLLCKLKDCSFSCLCKTIKIFSRLANIRYKYYRCLSWVLQQVD